MRRQQQYILLVTDGRSGLSWVAHGPFDTRTDARSYFTRVWGDASEYPFVIAPIHAPIVRSDAW